MCAGIEWRNEQRIVGLAFPRLGGEKESKPPPFCKLVKGNIPHFWPGSAVESFRSSPGGRALFHAGQAQKHLWFVTKHFFFRASHRCSEATHRCDGVGRQLFCRFTRLAPENTVVMHHLTVEIEQNTVEKIHLTVVLSQNAVLCHASTVFLKKHR